jgi:bleomycin hydrolase
MKKILVLFFIGGIFAINLCAQKQEPYGFKEVKKLSATPVKSQDQTGTCWAFSTASFLESEAQRMGKGEHDLSEMFVVRHIYRQKCENYVRRQGHAQFGEGGLAHDLLNAVGRYGIAPESAYPGRKDPAQPYNHKRIESALKNMCDDYTALGKKSKLPENWLSRIDSALDAEFGKVPRSFMVNNTEFTPVSYREYLGIRPEDYVSVTSFSHHPFYKPFILEIPDNWANGAFYNLPLGDLMRCLNHSVQRGYTVEWDADVSNTGFSAQNGLAIVPQADWKDKNTAERNGVFKFWEPEKNVTQEYRQDLFDRQETMDDHLMHITGVLDEAHSGLFYVVKNSWGEISNLKGYIYVSEAYMRLNTLSFTVHKEALPPDVRKQIGIEGGDLVIPKSEGVGNAPKKGPVDKKKQENMKAKMMPMQEMHLEEKALPKKAMEEQ